MISGIQIDNEKWQLKVNTWLLGAGIAQCCCHQHCGLVCILAMYWISLSLKFDVHAFMHSHVMVLAVNKNELVIVSLLVNNQCVDTTSYRLAPLEWHPTPTPIFLQDFRLFCTSRTSHTKVPLLCAFPSTWSQCFLRVQTPKNHFVRHPVHPAYVTHKKCINLLIPQLVPHFAPFVCSVAPSVWNCSALIPMWPTCRILSTSHLTSA